jgi:rhodanese-related sulfurtransferase
MNSELPSVDVSDVQPLRDAGATVLDVREKDEWSAGHIRGAVHIPMHQIPARVGVEVGLEQPIVVVCKVGGRSAHVSAWLRGQGYDARNLDGGMLAWAVARQPMTTEDGQPPLVY